MNASLDPSVAARILDILQCAHHKGRDMLFEHEVYDILEELEIPTPTHLVVRSERDITRSALATFSSRKVVLKVISPQVTHKRNAGGIRMVYKDLDFVRYSFQRLRATFEAAGSAFEGALLVEFAPETVAIHHGWPAETVERIAVGDAFLPPGTLPLAASAMQAHKSGGIFELFDSSLGPDGWSAGVYQLALSVADQADAPADLQGAADTVVTVSMPGNGMQIGRIYFNSRGDVLAVDIGDVRERLALTGNRLLASLGLGPPEALRDVFPERIWQGTQQLLDELADSQRAGE